jgi:hypothetical protein
MSPLPLRHRIAQAARFAGIVLSLAVCGIAAEAQTGRQRELEVKAAYLFNFGRFVRWPAASLAPGAPFGVCIIGHDPFGPVLDRILAGETIDGHRVVAHRVASTREASPCHIAFVSEADRSRRRAALADLASRPILTVGDRAAFTDDGGIVGFVPVGSRIRFELNEVAADRAGLALGSELARVALEVHRESQ